MSQNNNQQIENSQKPLKHQKTKFADLGKSQKTMIIVNNTISVCLSLFLVGFFIYIMSIGDPNNRMVSCICTFLLYLAPIILQWIFKVRITPTLITIYLAFITLSAFCGSCLRLNNFIPYLDKIQHTTWGYIAGLIGLYYLCKTKEIDTLKPFTIIFIFFAASMATASLWEIIEFTGDTFLGQTAQGHPDINGVVDVTDTMLDMIVHLCGTLVFTLHYCLDSFTHKNLGITYIINDFKVKY
ncbi:MAG: hypothetical protein IJW32_02120 [Clostridia bacterium]|nr:hypothetical protein [Clostridia bacterium]